MTVAPAFGPMNRLRILAQGVGVDAAPGRIEVGFARRANDRTTKVMSAAIAAKASQRQTAKTSLNVGIAEGRWPNQASVLRENS